MITRKRAVIAGCVAVVGTLALFWRWLAHSELEPGPNSYAVTSTQRAVIAGCIAVMFGCIWGAASLHLAHRTRNWLYYVETVGCVFLVAGVVGQRVFPDPNRVTMLGAERAKLAAGSVWESSIPFPGFSFSLTPIAVGGLVVLAAGAALLLFFEGAHAGPDGADDAFRSIDADDAN